jgi:hypothetical protein
MVEQKGENRKWFSRKDKTAKVEQKRNTGKV